MTTVVLHTGDEPDVIRSLSAEYHDDAREIVVRDCSQECGERGVMTTLTYAVDDVPLIAAALMAEYARVRFDADPRQMEWIL